jgi:FixJ family two-component response regulator
MALKGRILVVDDEPIVCERLKPALEKVGFYVETYTDSQNAIDRLAVVIITGFATVDSAREAMKSGAADFIAKPFKIRQLRDLILRIVEK